MKYEENEVEPIRVMMSVKSLVRLVLWAGIVLALVILLVVMQFGEAPEDSSASSTSTAGCAI